jgi:hypothetical protein
MTMDCIYGNSHLNQCHDLFQLLKWISNTWKKPLGLQVSMPSRDFGSFVGLKKVGKFIVSGRNLNCLHQPGEFREVLKVLMLANEGWWKSLKICCALVSSSEQTTFWYTRKASQIFRF